MGSQSSELATQYTAPRVASETVRPLRVLLDARKLFDGGIGVYTQNLITGLSAEPEIQLSIIIGDQEPITSAVSEFEWYPRVSVISDRARPYSIDEFMGLPRRLNLKNFDLFHVPHYTLPFGIHIPCVVTLHDLIHLTHPERFYYPFVAKRLIGSAVRRASKILVVSRATRDQLTTFFGNQVEPTKVIVIPNAIDSFFRAAVAPTSFRAGELSLQDRYFLCVCSQSKPHKGLKDLLKAFSSFSSWLKSSHGTTIKLVLVGQGIEQSSFEDGVLGIGSVSKSELRTLYAGATALVVPSLAEGFYLPILEAHAQGTPVVSRPVPAIQELLWASDVTCKDMGVTALAQGMCSFIERYGTEPQRFYNQERLDKFNPALISSIILRAYRGAVEKFGERQ